VGVGAGHEVVLNRKEHKRHKDARLIFNPRLVCTINGRTLDPVLAGPESYYVTILPGFSKFIVTPSRDRDDGWGCAGHAIGVADGSLSATEAANRQALGSGQRLCRVAKAMGRRTILAIPHDLPPFLQGAYMTHLGSLVATINLHVMRSAYRLPNLRPVTARGKRPLLGVIASSPG
jgi:hypothetical protein